MGDENMTSEFFTFHLAPRSMFFPWLDTSLNQSLFLDTHLEKDTKSHPQPLIFRLLPMS